MLDPSGRQAGRYLVASETANRHLVMIEQPDPRILAVAATFVDKRHADEYVELVNFVTSNLSVESATHANSLLNAIIQRVQERMPNPAGDPGTWLTPPLKPKSKPQASRPPRRASVRFWLEDEDETVARMHKDGIELQSIADDFGVSRNAIKHRLKAIRRRVKAGSVPRETSSLADGFTKTEKADIVCMAQEGEPRKVIADRFGLDEDEIHRVVCEYADHPKSDIRVAYTRETDTYEFVNRSALVAPFGGLNAMSRNRVVAMAKLGCTRGFIADYYLVTGAVIGDIMAAWSDSAFPSGGCQYKLTTDTYEFTAADSPSVNETDGVTVTPILRMAVMTAWHTGETVDQIAAEHHLPVDVVIGIIEENRVKVAEAQAADPIELPQAVGRDPGAPTSVDPTPEPEPPFPVKELSSAQPAAPNDITLEREPGAGADAEVKSGLVELTPDGSAPAATRSRTSSKYHAAKKIETKERREKLKVMWESGEDPKVIAKALGYAGAGSVIDTARYHMRLEPQPRKAAELTPSAPNRPVAKVATPSTQFGPEALSITKTELVAYIRSRNLYCAVLPNGLYRAGPNPTPINSDDLLELANEIRKKLSQEKISLVA